MRHIRIETGDDGIALLTLDNADEPVNLVSDAWLDEVEQAVATLSASESVKGVIVTSAKRDFLAGADLKAMIANHGRLSRKDAFNASQRASRVYRAIETGGKPWVAAINGLALGGGMELALACHYRLLASDTNAVVGFPEVKLGLLPGAGGTQRLPRIAGVQASLEPILTGRSLKPDEALRLKFVHALAPAAELVAKAREWLATNPEAVKPWDKKGYRIPESHGILNPETAMLFSGATASVVAKAGYTMPAPATILACIFEGVQLPFDRALALESKYFATLLTSPIARNIIRTTFVSKNAAERGARRPEGVPKAKVRKLGVLGAGMMGSGIALVSAAAGIEVVLLDRDVPSAEKGKGYAVAAWAKEVSRGRRTQESAAEAAGRITPTDDYAQLADADLIVEAVFEDTGIKADTTRKAEAVIPEQAVFASNTSTLPISQLAKASLRPDQFIGIHFFSPVEKMLLVEIIRGKQTSDATLAKALDYVAQLRKVPIVVNDSRGFYTSRVFQMMVHEGLEMLQEGVPPAMIENTATAAGYPVGPLALLDELSFDLTLRIADQTKAELGDGYDMPAGIEAVRTMRDTLGRGGRKAGGGFYDYPDGGKKRLWSGLAEQFPRSDGHDPEELKKRYLYAQAIETARCLEEGVIETVQDADLGAVFGWGFPPWTGGTLSFIDTVGIEEFVREADRLAQAYGARFAPSPWLRARAARGEGFYPG